MKWYRRLLRWLLLHLGVCRSELSYLQSVYPITQHLQPGDEITTRYGKTERHLFIGFLDADTAVIYTGKHDHLSINRRKATSRDLANAIASEGTKEYIKHITSSGPRHLQRIQTADLMESYHHPHAFYRYQHSQGLDVVRDVDESIFEDVRQTVYNELAQKPDVLATGASTSETSSAQNMRSQV